MQTITKDVSGGAVFWSLGDNTNRPHLIRGLEDAGFGNFAPKERTPKSALEDALRELYQDKFTLVRPLEKQDAFTVVREKRGQEQNEYAPLLTATVEEHIVIIEPADEMIKIQTAYDLSRQRLPGSTVAVSLVQIQQALDGVALRPSGGFYWLPAHSLERWEKVAAVVEAAGGNKVWVMRTAMDERTLAAVKDSVIGDLTGTLDKIAEQVRSGELGEKALTARAAETRDMKRRLSSYETILGGALDELRAKIADVDTITAHAAVLASAQLDKAAASVGGVAP